MRIAVAGLLLVLLLVEAYKLSGVCRHLVWIARNGDAYRRALVRLREKNKAVSSDDLYQSLKRIGGDKVTVLGFKEFRVRARSERQIASARRADRLAGRMLQLAVRLYDFVALDD